MKFSYCKLDADFLEMWKWLDFRLSYDKANILLLKGDLGAGKTTFVKEYLSHLGYDKNSIDSPTFSIVNTYRQSDKKSYHFDLYRLNTPEEIDDLGFFEYTESGNLCFVEWPEKIADFLPKDKVLNLNISVSSNQCREYLFS
jgi:tRNA threonylcarbamoyladenosine biosynthesis protein TsaE